MQRDLAGFVGGVIGGLAMLIIDQVTFALNISSVNSIGILSGFLFPAGGINYVAGWLIGLLITGVTGWIVAKILPEKFTKDNFITPGLILGVVLWGLMNIAFTISGRITPTWAMGANDFSLIVNLITHLVLGVIITYTLWRSKRHNIVGD